MFTVGQEVTVESSGKTYDAISTYGRVGIREGAIGTVKRVNRNTLHIRFDNELLTYSGYGTYSGAMTLIVPIEQVVPTDPNAPRPRKLGEKPEAEGNVSAVEPLAEWERELLELSAATKAPAKKKPAAEADAPAADPNAPRPRKLGEKPEGDEFIDPNDPGLMWLWDDIAAYADKQGYCSQFDTITNALGIPGRKRDVTVIIIVGDGIEAKTTIKARSPKEARDVLTAQGITVKN